MDNRPKFKRTMTIYLDADTPDQLIMIGNKILTAADGYLVSLGATKRLNESTGKYITMLGPNNETEETEENI